MRFSPQPRRGSLSVALAFYIWKKKKGVGRLVDPGPGTVLDHRPACSEPVAWPPTPKTDRVAYGITPTTMEITPGTESDCENIRQPTTGGGPSLGIGRPVFDGRRGAPRDGHEDIPGIIR